jgi:hypothetical protein
MKNDSFGFSVMYDRVLHLVTTVVPYRERRNKDSLVIAAVKDRYPILFDKIIGGLEGAELQSMKASLISFVRDVETADRARRKVMEEHPDLRGTDYPQKNKLEEEAQLELGYESPRITD